MWPMNLGITGMWLWWLFGLALLVLLVWPVAHAGRSPVPRRDEDSPETMLKRRYARGELGELEYERRLNNLKA